MLIKKFELVNVVLQLGLLAKSFLYFIRMFKLCSLYKILQCRIWKHLLVEGIFHLFQLHFILENNVANLLLLLLVHSQSYIVKCDFLLRNLDLFLVVDLLKFVQYSCKLVLKMLFSIFSWLFFRSEFHCHFVDDFVELDKLSIESFEFNVFFADDVIDQVSILFVVTCLENFNLVVFLSQYFHFLHVQPINLLGGMLKLNQKFLDLNSLFVVSRMKIWQKPILFFFNLLKCDDFLLNLIFQLFLKSRNYLIFLNQKLIKMGIFLSQVQVLFFYHLELIIADSSLVHVVHVICRWLKRWLLLVG